jgi:uncharacterized RDD family membrane protein YckC
MPKFITSQNIEIDLELASVGDRIFAFLIDFLIHAAYFILVLLLVSGIGGDNMTILVLTTPVMFYSLLFELFGDGQSPGKRARDIKVVKLDGSSPTLGSYLLRWMFRILDIYTMYGCVGIVSMISSKNTQRIGDMLAGTAVIKVRHVGTAQAFKLSSPDYIVTFPTARMLSDDQVELMRKALRMFQQHHQMEGVVQLSVKLKEKLGVQTSLGPLEFVETVIKDYEHLMNE